MIDSVKTRWYIYTILFLCSFVLYFNTLSHDYALDDAIVITDNDFTHKGFAGIVDHLTHESFTGFFKEEKKLVSGGRYRPLSFITFSIEYELFGLSPEISHFINVLIYAILAIVLFNVLNRLLKNYVSRWYFSISFIATLFFIFHPIHTEVVANIKGRDEMLTLLGALLALHFTLKYIEGVKPVIENQSNNNNKSKNNNSSKKQMPQPSSNESFKYLLYAAISFFLGLMSKENAITFLVIIPVALYFFTNSTLKKIVISTLPLFLVSILFIYIRSSVVGFSSNEEVNEILNNPFLGLTSSEIIGTIIYTLGRYIELLIFPNVLTYDYYPYHVPIYSLASFWPLFYLLVYLFLIFIALKSLKSKSVIGFGIIIYLASLSIVSNIFFPVGTFMNERFVFISSIGFVIIIAWGLHQVMNLSNKRYIRYLFAGISLIVLILFSLKTIDRNRAWKDDLTLFTTDVKTSSKSAKSTCSAGGKLLEYGKEMKDSVRKFEYLELSKKYLIQSTVNYCKIIPNGIYVDAELLLGNCYFEFGQFDSTLYHYKRICLKAPGNDKIYQNANITINRFDDIDKKISETKEFYKFNPNVFELNYNLGKWYGQFKNNIDSAIFYLERAVFLKKNSKEGYKDLGVAYGFKHRYNDAITVFKKAEELAPDDEQIFYNLAITYSYMDDVKNAVLYFEKLYQTNPNNENYQKMLMHAKSLLK